VTRVAVVVGNPRPRSRTLAAATYLAGQLVGRDPDQVVDLADLGPRLLDRHDDLVSATVAEVGAADLVVFASPTYKGAYTGLLKLFLDRFATDGLRGVAVPLMLGAGPGHAMAPELTLRPVLTEIGALVPARGLYVIDAQHEEPEAYRPWLDLARPAITAILDSRTGVSA
jgi:FMN reductase